MQDRIQRTIGATAAILATAAAQDAATRDRVAAEIEAALDKIVGERAFADLPTALREAELQAIQITLSIYAAGLPRDSDSTGAPGRAFHDAAVRFSATELAAAKAVAGASRRIAKRPEGSSRTIAQRRLAAEEGLLTEIDLALGPRRIPERFLALYLDPRPDGAAWYDAFTLYIAWHIRSDKALQVALAQAAIPALAEAGQSIEALLERNFADAKRIALGLEDRLAAAEAAANTTSEIENREVEAFLARLPAEIAQRESLPVPLMERVARILREAGPVTDHFELRLNDQARRAKALISSLGASKGTVEAQALALVKAGDLSAANDVVAKLPSSAANELIKANVASLAASWKLAKDHLNRAIELIEPKHRQQALDAAVQLARVLREEARPVSQAMAADLYDAVAGAAAKDLDPQRQAELYIEMVSALLASRKSARQLSLLTSAVSRGEVWPESSFQKLPPALAARFAEARAKALLGLAVHGADRASEARGALVGAIHAAQAAADARLTSELNIGLHDVLVQQTRKAAAADAPRLREEARRALLTALTPRLRSRDPIWWTEVKVRGAAAALADQPQQEPDLAALKAALISVKAALRLVPKAVLPGRFASALNVVADLCLALEQAEPNRRWTEHAVAAYEEALAAIDPVVSPFAWADLQVKMAEHLPGADAVDPARGDRAIGCLRAALSVTTAKSLRAARIQRLLGDALSNSGKHRMDIAPLEEAVSLYREALEHLTPAGGPWLCVCTWTGLAGATSELARLRHDAVLLEPLIPELKAAADAVRKAAPAPWIIRALAKVVAETQQTVKKMSNSNARPQVTAPARRVAMLLRRG